VDLTLHNQFSWLALLYLVTAGGCSRNQATVAYDPAAPVAVVVRNNNVQDVDVFATSDGARRRLGTVVSHSSQTYFLEAAFVSGGRVVVLLAEPIANRGGRIQARVGVQPGQEIRWNLESSLERSFVSVH
jgi:hypothetical protein